MSLAADNHCNLLACVDPEAVTGGLDPPPPPPTLKKHKTIGLLINTGPDPLKNHKAAKPAFNVGLSSACQRNACRPMMAPFNGIWILSPHQLKKTLPKLGWTPSAKTFWIWACWLWWYYCPERNNCCKRENSLEIQFISSLPLTISLLHL